MTAIELDVKQNAYDEARGRVFYRKLLDASRADPGIESATLAAYVPMGLLDTRVQRVSIEGYEPRQGEDLAFMSNTVGSDYFRTLRITVTAGREFEDRDDETGAPVAVVNATLAQRFWGSASNAIGKRLRVGDRDVADRRRRGRRREVLADQRSAAPVFLCAIPPGLPVGHDPAHAGHSAG